MHASNEKPLSRGGILGTAAVATAVKAPGPIDRAVERFGDVGMAATRVEALVDKLIGGAAQEGSGPPSGTPVTGEFGRLNDATDGAAWALARLHDALDRLEGAL